MSKENEQNRKLMIGCKHDGSFVPVGEVDRLMDLARKEERLRCQKETEETFYRKLNEISCRQTKKSVWHKKDGTIEVQVLPLNRMPAGRIVRDIFNETIKEVADRRLKGETRK